MSESEPGNEFDEFYEMTREQRDLARELARACGTKLADEVGMTKCPACMRPAAYAPGLKAWAHADGSANLDCWLACLPQSARDG